MNERSPYASSMLWCLAGGVVGAGLGLLLAPQSGRTTRDMMTRRFKEGVGSARELRDRVVTRGEEAWDEASHRAREAASALAGSTERKVAKRNDIPTVQS